MNVRSSKPTALCRGSANALASPCVSVKAILTAYSRTQGEVFFATSNCDLQTNYNSKELEEQP